MKQKSRKEYLHSFNHTFNRIESLKDLGFVPANICDVGASNGQWSRKCLKIFPDAEYFLVEPLAENQSLLDQLCKEYKNVNYWMGCLGSESGRTIINVDGDGTSILSGHFGNPYGVQREVNVETLDSLIEKSVCPIPEFIKIDVQGYELEVLKGARNALHDIGAIVAEVSFFPFQDGMPVFHEVVSQVAEYGYVVYDILSLSLRPLDNAAAQTDILFLKKTNSFLKDNRWDIDSTY